MIFKAAYAIVYRLEMGDTQDLEVLKVKERLALD